MSSKALSCPDCGQGVIEVALPDADHDVPDVYVEFECIRDGINCVHPGKVRLGGENGPVVVEYPFGFEVGQPIVFDRKTWDRLFAEPA